MNPGDPEKCVNEFVVLPDLPADAINTNMSSRLLHCRRRSKLLMLMSWSIVLFVVLTATLTRERINFNLASLFLAVGTTLRNPPSQVHTSAPAPVPAAPHAAPSLVVHLDLKGSPPTMTFLKQFLRLIAAEGADGLLVEYEDMFPFEGSLANLSAPNAYTKKQVHTFLGWAAQMDLQVIPLVQTFGHMEYVLKLPEFKHLRERENSSRALCPKHPESMMLVKEMLRQVMRVHLSSKAPPHFLHIGCDEVFDMRFCNRCNLSGLSRGWLACSGA